MQLTFRMLGAISSADKVKEAYMHTTLYIVEWQMMSNTY